MPKPRQCHCGECAYCRELDRHRKLRDYKRGIRPLTRETAGLERMREAAAFREKRQSGRAYAGGRTSRAFEDWSRERLAALAHAPEAKA